MFDLPTKAPGDRLEAAHVNELNRAARLMLQAGGDGGGLGGIGSRAFTRRPFVQALVKVHCQLPIIGTYSCRLRYYDGEVWRTDKTTDYDLDCSDLLDDLPELGELQCGDILVAWWHPQREAFIPTGNADATTTTTPPDPFTTTTAATPTTPGGPPCSTAQSKWVWDGAGGCWKLSGNNCTTSTSTTTSTTAPAGSSSTTSSTTTTPDSGDDCGDCDTSTTGGATSSSTTSGTTSTPCQCQPIPPVAPGIADGDCAYTDCSCDTFSTPYNCTTTTAATSTTAGTPTTPCDCGTTTTAGNGGPCSGKCSWQWNPTGPPILSCFGCKAGCTCAPPTDLGPCNQCEDTNCTCPPPPTPPPPSCGGNCTYWCGPQGWVLSDDGCVGVGEPCTCAPPTSTCAPGNCDGCAAPIIVPCGVPPGGAGTPTTPGGPCADCYTSSTAATSTTAATTTTAGPCTQGCDYRGDGAGGWTLVNDGCDHAVCSCITPPGTSHATCEVVHGPCVDNGSTTTSTTSTPSGTTTSTTTTVPCAGPCTTKFVATQNTGWVQYGGTPCATTNCMCTAAIMTPGNYICPADTISEASFNGKCVPQISCGSCAWRSPPPGGPWVLVSNNCSDGCGCDPPNYPYLNANTCERVLPNFAYTPCYKR